MIPRVDVDNKAKTVHPPQVLAPGHPRPLFKRGEGTADVRRHWRHASGCESLPKQRVASGES